MWLWGYCFVCNGYVLYVVLLRICQTDLCKRCCMYLSWYIPLRLWSLGLGVSCWYIVLVGRKAIFKLVRLERLVTLYVEGLWYVKV